MFHIKSVEGIKNKNSDSLAYQNKCVIYKSVHQALQRDIVTNFIYILWTQSTILIANNAK